MHLKEKNISNYNPNVDDSIKPDFKVLWRNKSSNETGHCTFFTYDYGMEIIEAVFTTIHPDREILQIRVIS